MSANLGIAQLIDGQAGKVTAINNALSALDAALTETLAISAAAFPVNVTAAQMQKAFVLVFSGQGAAGTVNLPVMKRVITLRNTGAFDLNITVGTTTLVLAAATNMLAILDGTANGLARLLSGGSSSSAGLPAGGTTGQVLTKTSSVDGAAAWASPASGGSSNPDLNPPLAADWTARGAASIRDVANKGLLVLCAYNNGAAGPGATKALPGSWSAIKCKIKPPVMHGNYASFGFGIASSGTNKQIVLSQTAQTAGSPSALQALHYNAWTYNDRLANSAGISFGTADTQWYRVRKDGTSFYFDVSTDGEEWLQYADDGLTAWTTGYDTVFFFISPGTASQQFRGGNISMLVENYTEG